MTVIDNYHRPESSLIVMPPCASVFAGRKRRSVETSRDNLERSTRGVSLETVVDPARGH